MATVPLLPGIWRSGTGSLNLLECRKEGVCVGGNASSDGHPFMYCRNHHVGPLCEVWTHCLVLCGTCWYGSLAG